PHAPEGALQVASARISSIAGQPRHHLLFYAFLLALVVAPFAGRNAWRTVIFALITLAVAWIQMAIGANTGGSVHHTLLLWPLPQLIIAVSFAGASLRLGRAGKPVVAVVLAIMVVSGALVINEHFTVAVRNGGTPAWTDGIVNLAKYMKGVPAKFVFCMDWGM